DGDLDRRLLLLWRDPFENVQAWIYGDLRTPGGTPNDTAIFLDGQLRIVDRRRHKDDEFREGRLKRCEMLLCEGEAVGAVLGTREARRLRKLGPGGRRLAFLLVAKRNVEKRAGSCIEAQALFELAARLGDLSSGQERAPFEKERRG